ncbi:hypothetical protein [Cupriavidus basilensis]|uniref:hypothetical protein n=1 Tax=Cupriavidus basilensis TaxID=68895 RepID=UPI00284412AB|nr:hypothetical protein [Cupriavidus basilensis]MDR3383486.1 hypothetical protein [Cupriavidus basilensis]
MNAATKATESTPAAQSPASQNTWLQRLRHLEARLSKLFISLILGGDRRRLRSASLTFPRNKWASHQAQAPLNDRIDSGPDIARLLRSYREPIANSHLSFHHS